MPRNSHVAGAVPALLLWAMTGCTPGTWPDAPAETPPPDPATQALLAAAGAPDYWRDVKPVLDQRCVVCHACFDAPCQLNLAAFEGIERGASKDVVYTATRVREAAPTRLFLDSPTAAGWRGKGFYSVLDDVSPTSPAAARQGLMLKLLTQKRQHPQVAAMPLGKDYDVAIDRDQQCPAPEEFPRFAKRFPQWGMPYGLPGLADAEFATLAGWLARGAPYRPPAAPDAAVLEEVAAWEAFLNGPSPKERLMSRYLYEHLYLGTFHFDIGPSRQFFRLIRSRTAPGQPVEVIATRRPFDDPGTEAFWYRLEPVHATVVAKTHMPYRLDAARMERFRQLFLAPDYEVASLPDYSPPVASNPFVAFAALPVESRYRFMLDDAEYFIQGFMKGPVCRGQVAVDVIDDRFWVVFAAPDGPLTEQLPGLLELEGSRLRLPADSETTPFGLLSWRRYRDRQVEYLQAKQQFMEESAERSQVDLSLVWDGDGKNTNAALTIFRHSDNASVVRGLVGEPPKTAWVIGYSLFERIHYLLVAGFDVFGTAGHQLNTRLYMDFLRMEGEFNFLTLLPEASRKAVRDYWYRDADKSVREYVYGSRIAFDRDSDIRYTTDDPRLELLQMLAKKLAPVHDQQHDLRYEPDAALRAELGRLASLRGESATLMPELAFLAVTGAGTDGPAIYSLARDTAHTNVASLFREEKRFVPAENTLFVGRGFIGAYPNAFFRVARAELPAFTSAVAGLRSEAEYRALVARFGVDRTNPGFWQHSDTLARTYAGLEPVASGIFDFGRLENR
ncbi:MAG: fatty acid cis/trans isomerase [Chromatiales bacterium]|nr:fatty acid cis/trans isomerase [Chromatiales bacterium]